MAKGLELIGDPAAGRPTLGANAPVAMFRALRMVGMMEGLNALIGDASTLVYAAGKGVGKELGQAILEKTGGNVDAFVAATAAEVKNLGVGIMKVTHADLDNGLLEIKVDECITCSGAPVIGKRVCHFEAGFVSGVLEPLVQKQVNVVETACNCMGEDGCVFECKF